MMLVLSSMPTAPRWAIALSTITLLSLAWHAGTDYAPSWDLTVTMVNRSDSSARASSTALPVVTTGAMPSFDFDDRLLLEEGADDDVRLDQPLSAAEQGDDGMTISAGDIDDDDSGAEVMATVEAETSSATPFMPVSCDTAPSSPVSRDALKKAQIFVGTGQEVRRALRRQMRNHLVGLARATGQLKSTRNLAEEGAFSIMVLGGSVSNCRGVDASTECWHARTHQWFEETVPLEGDPGFNKALASYKKATQRQRTRRALAHRRKRPRTRLTNLARSASGSAYFAYCFNEHLRIRDKTASVSDGPHLVVLEFGINDVWPISEQATRDFERLVRTLLALPSRPALVILEAASLLLARTTSSKDNAEFLHLPVARHYDIPVLSMKEALFGPSNKGAQSQDLESLFLPDLHHPNAQGHQVMNDILTTFLQEQACRAQAESLSKTIPQKPLYEMIELRSPSAVPATGVFSTSTNALCHQVGVEDPLLVPSFNEGWSRFSWARDKQYLVANEPGSKLSFTIQVGRGGEVLVDWLRSRFYDLGDVLVYLDGDRRTTKRIAGYWELGWSIGVPTKVFEGVREGTHEVTFELLGPSESSHPKKAKSHFRLIGIITT